MGSKTCVFCKIIKKDISADILFESDSFIVMRDVHPVRAGHTLVIPKKHMVTLLDIPDTFGKELLHTIKKTAGILLDEKYGDGFNVVMNNLAVAGQTVMHAHIHIIPRTEDDGLHIVR